MTNEEGFVRNPFHRELSASAEEKRGIELLHERDEVKALVKAWSKPRVDAFILTTPLATASRWVSGFWVTSTIRGRPDASMCVSPSATTGFSP